MPYFLFAIPAILLLLLILFRKPKDASAPSASGEVFSLETVDGADCFVCDGKRFYEVSGEDVQDTVWWDWHGRMGKGLGLLTRPGNPFPVGELYCLREGKGDILLAHLPEEGWPLTDMKLFLAEGASLPTLTSHGFAYGEVYRIEGDLGEEEWTKVCEIADPSHCSFLAETWLEGEEISLPEGEYIRFRVRLYWAEEPGLYVTFNVNVSEEGVAALELYRFRGDALLSEEVKGLFLFQEEDFEEE